MREVYEVDAPSPLRTAADIHPEHEAFWKYRTRVTVDLVTRNFQDVKSNKTAHKILGKFLNEVIWVTANELIRNQDIDMLSVLSRDKKKRETI